MKYWTKGIGFVEVLMSSALLGATIYFVVGMYRQQSRDIQTSRISETHFEVLEKVILEIQGKAARDLPNNDFCRVRTYDSSGIFISEVEEDYPISDELCSEEIVEGNEYRVVIKSQAATEELLKLEFLKSDLSSRQLGLKLPKYGATLKIVEVSVALNGKEPLHFSTFKGN